MTSLTDVRRLIAEAKSIIVHAGAGMSAELGISPYWTGPNARYGSELSPYGYTDLEHAHAALWDAEPAMQAAFFAQKIAALEAVNPLQPGSAYALLQRLIGTRRYMVSTSNPDSMFHRAGFVEPSLFEVHGTYRHSQCTIHPAEHGVFPTHIVDGTLRCPSCGNYARPNVLFFDDFGMNEAIYQTQWEHYHTFVNACDPNLTVVLEVGAGATIPTIRNATMRLNSTYDFHVVRINPQVESGVDGAAFIYPRSKKAQFIQLRTPATRALTLLTSPTLE